MTSCNKFRRFLSILLWVLMAAVVVNGDPITATGALAWWASLAISAAITAATTAAQLLLNRPKTPKPIDKDKLSGDVKITTIGENIAIPEIYGRRQDDNLGGFQHGCVLVHASPITKIVENVPGGTGGGKGGPRAPSTQIYHYYQSYALLVGRGPLNVLSLKANTDVIYTNAALSPPAGTRYEAEDPLVATLGGGASVTGDGFRVENVGLGGTVTFTFPGPMETSTYEVYIGYKSQLPQDFELEVTINGEVRPLVPLPDSDGAVRYVFIPANLLAATTNTIVLGNAAAVTAEIDALVVHETITHCLPPLCCPPAAPDSGSTDSCDDGMVSGALYPGFTNLIPTYDNIGIIDPNDIDKRSFTEWNYQPQEDSEQVTTFTPPLMSIRIVPGSMTQLPDPMMEAHFSQKYGSVDAAPAYRGRCMIYIENMEITKYSGTMPNFIVTSEHKTIDTLAGMFEDRATRAGLDEAEIDFSDLDDVLLRGYAIMQVQAPKTDMGHLAQIFDIDVFETVDGVIEGTKPTETVSVTIPIEELDVREGYDPKSPNRELPSPVQTIIRDEYQLPKIFSVSFFDANNQYETAEVNTQREYTVSNKREIFDTQMVMTKLEAQQFADRQLQKLYAEKDALRVSTFYKYATIVPTDLIAIEELDGSITHMRVKVVDGWIPGNLSISGTSRYAVELAPRVGTPDTRPVTFGPGGTKQPRLIAKPQIPSHVVGTLIDVAILRSTEYETGFYIAACNTNSHFDWRGAVLMVEKAGGYEKLTEIPNQAMMGRSVVGEEFESLPIDLPSAIEPDGPSYEPESTLLVDLFWGEFMTKTEEEVEDKDNAILVGNEVMRFVTATRVEGYTNRWLLTGLHRRDKGTSGDSHDTVPERVVLLNGDVKWVKMDATELGTTRNYKFVAPGQIINNVSSTEFTFVGKTTQTSNVQKVPASGSYDVQMSDGLVEIDATSGTATVHLPDVWLAQGHEPWTIKKVDATMNQVRIFGATETEDVEGSTYFPLSYQYDSVDVFADVNGTWKIK
jgi:hypothetical protein